MMVFQISSVQYATICDDIKKIKMDGKQSYLAKTDVESAFRINPVSVYRLSFTRNGMARRLLF